MNEDASWRTDLVGAARRLSTALWAGLLCGAVIGGGGGRFAMFLLRVTSSASLHGLETDDGFSIGRFSGATIFLIVVTAVFGALGGVLYLGVRKWIPYRYRPLAMGLFGGAVGGAIVIRPGGLDFT